MKRPVILAEMQRAHVPVLKSLASRGYVIATFSYLVPQADRTELEEAGRFLAVETLITDADRLELRAVAAERTGAVLAHLEQRPLTFDVPGVHISPAELTRILCRSIEDWILHSQLVLRAFDRLAEHSSVRGVLLSADYSRTQRVMAQWGRDRGIPTFHLTHGSNIGRRTGIYGEVFCDYILIPGERGGEDYVDACSTARLVVVGNAKWDVYAGLLPEKERLRAELRARFGLPSDGLIAFHAMTGAPPLTAAREELSIEAMLETFLAACAMVRTAGLHVLPLVKDRPTTPGAQQRRKGLRETVVKIAARNGLDSVVYAMDEPVEPFLVASDVLVAADSNLVLEAALCGVVPINMWNIQNLLLGPYFGAEDGIPHVDGRNPAALARTMYQVLTDQATRIRLLEGIGERLPYLLGPHDGESLRRAVECILDVIGAPA